MFHSTPKLGQYLILVAAATSIGVCIGSQINFVRGPHSPERLTGVYDYWDTQMRSKTEPGRGVFVKFVNFPAGTLGEGYAQTIYFRTAYIIYPLPVIVTRPGVVVNEGKDFLKDNSYPSEQWLLGQGVGSIVTVRYEAKKDRPYLGVESVRWLNN